MKTNSIKFIAVLLMTGMAFYTAFAQQVPHESEGFDYLITFGKESKTSYGDDDFVQVLFFVVPDSRTEPFYIRVFDPEIGGSNDTKVGEGFNTKNRFSVYGKTGALTASKADDIFGKVTLNSGSLLSAKIFDKESAYDNKWYTFGPFNPKDGEALAELKGTVFKLVVEGVKGDDGNVYKFFLSRKQSDNLPVEGGNIFTYKYSVRMNGKKTIPTHVYPFIDESVSSITIHNFDFDNMGELKLYSTVRLNDKGNVSGDNVWAKSVHVIKALERNSTIDVRVIMKKPVNNDFAICVTNQYNKAVRLFSVPIGGPPKYKYKVQMKVD